MYRLHQRLIGLRRRHPWLVRARTEVRHLTNTAVAFEAADDGAGRFLTLLNLGAQAYRFPLDGAGLAVAETSGGDPHDPCLVPAHGWTIVTSRNGLHGR
ncbi:DUF3459 domain-containing protein [Acrocarpospora sp. B8E8]|uniref:DUF3459 domain-containing protein n=1 Tax=Acrocarpospora sp. B8E8 TaxID=3153572 RepID=UPI00325CC6D2